MSLDARLGLRSKSPMLSATRAVTGFGANRLGPCALNLSGPPNIPPIPLAGMARARESEEQWREPQGQGIHI